VPFESSGLAAAQLTWTVAQGAKSAASGASPDGTSSSFDTTRVPDGVYVMTPHAATASGSIDGEPRTVYVLNGTETGSIAFQGLTAGQTMTGEPALNITIQASPVPLTLVTFSVVDSTGKAIVTRSTWDTGATMQMNWNTAEVPNGNYTIKLEGVAGSQVVTPATATVVVKN
jgi:hypothetical protein